MRSTRGAENSVSGSALLVPSGSHVRFSSSAISGMDVAVPSSRADRPSCSRTVRAAQVGADQDRGGTHAGKRARQRQRQAARALAARGAGHGDHRQARTHAGQLQLGAQQLDGGLIDLGVDVHDRDTHDLDVLGAADAIVQAAHDQRHQGEERDSGKEPAEHGEDGRRAAGRNSLHRNRTHPNLKGLVKLPPAAAEGSLQRRSHCC